MGCIIPPRGPITSRCAHSPAFHGTVCMDCRLVGGTSREEGSNSNIAPVASSEGLLIGVASTEALPTQPVHPPRIPGSPPQTQPPLQLQQQQHQHLLLQLDEQDLEMEHEDGIPSLKQLPAVTGGYGSYGGRGGRPASIDDPGSGGGPLAAKPQELLGLGGNSAVFRWGACGAGGCAGVGAWRTRGVTRFGGPGLGGCMAVFRWAPITNSFANGSMGPW